MIKNLIKSIKEYKKQTILTPIFVSVETIIEVLIPFFMAYLIDNGINKNDEKTILVVGILLCIAAIISLVFGIL